MIVMWGTTEMFFEMNNERAKKHVKEIAIYPEAVFTPSGHSIRSHRGSTYPDNRPLGTHYLPPLASAVDTRSIGALCDLVPILSTRSTKINRLLALLSLLFQADKRN